jgi:hypothetical protein
LHPVAPEELEKRIMAFMEPLYANSRAFRTYSGNWAKRYGCRAVWPLKMEAE